MPAKFLNNLPKNLTTHLTHKLYSVFPQLFCDTIIHRIAGSVKCCKNASHRKRGHRLMKEQRNITLAGETISYTLERKAVKNINMRLRPETGLLVSAPMHVPSERVEQILQQHAAKILQTLHQYAAAAEKPKQYPVHYTAGEPVLYLGKSCRLAVERGSRESVLVQGETLRLLVKQPENEQVRKQVFDSWWENACEKAVRNLCRAVYPVFEAKGVAFPEVRFRHMVSQWGNCRPTRGVLTFNLRLLAAPVRCMEYVVMHEFSHFLHPDHSPAFYAEIAAELPDWKQLQKQLRDVETRI